MSFLVVISETTPAYLWPNRQRSGSENATEEIPQFHDTTCFLSIYTLRGRLLFPVSILQRDGLAEACAGLAVRTSCQLNDRRWPVMKVRVHARTRHSTLSAALLVVASERHGCVATQCSSSLRQTDLGWQSRRQE
jgi:hypothetical protein